MTHCRVRNHYLHHPGCSPDRIRLLRVLPRSLQSGVSLTVHLPTHHPCIPNLDVTYNLTHHSWTLTNEYIESPRCHTSPLTFWISPEISNFILPIVTEGATDNGFSPGSTHAGNKLSAADRPITDMYGTETRRLYPGWERLQAGNTDKFQSERKVTPHPVPSLGRKTIEQRRLVDRKGR